jgi:ribose transport system substrate-binding protein
MAAVFSGCPSGNPANSSSGGGAKQRLILLTNGDDPFWDAMRKGMNQGAIDFKLDEAGMEVFLDKGDFSEESQINKLKQYGTQSDIAAVAISSVDAKNRGIAEAMRELRAKGVHVITVDSDMDLDTNRDTRFAYIGTNNVIGGEVLGMAAKGLKPEGGTYATFVGLKAVANAIERMSGFKTGAGEKFTEADSLGDGGDEDTAQENVKSALNNHKNLDTLVGIWAYNAHAIVQVVKERMLRDKVTIVGFDAAPLALTDMEEGYIDALVVQNPYQMGYLGTKLMKALVEKDHASIHELYPDYDPATGKFQTKDGDVYITELRVVVPDAASPLKSEMFPEGTKFFTYQQFRTWLSERKLTGS